MSEAVVNAIIAGIGSADNATEQAMQIIDNLACIAEGHGPPMTKRRDPISIAQKVLRDWCKDRGVVVDAMDGAQLVAEITAAIIKDREP